MDEYKQYRAYGHFHRARRHTMDDNDDSGEVCYGRKKKEEKKKTRNEGQRLKCEAYCGKTGEAILSS
jgi:hypothetical protein